MFCAALPGVADAGVTFLDNAWDCHGGASEEWMGHRRYNRTVCPSRADRSAASTMRRLS